MATRHTVPAFPPELRHIGLFAHSRTLQHFLLTKAVNGERAAYHAPKFLKLTVGPRPYLPAACLILALSDPVEPFSWSTASRLHVQLGRAQDGLQAGQGLSQAIQEESMVANWS